MKLTVIIQVRSALLAIFGIFNGQVIMLSEKIQRLAPVRLTPGAFYMDASSVGRFGDIAGRFSRNSRP
jgi:hypothetical protein